VLGLDHARSAKSQHTSSAAAAQFPTGNSSSIMEVDSSDGKESNLNGPGLDDVQDLCELYGKRATGTRSKLALAAAVLLASVLSILLFWEVRRRSAPRAPR